MKYVFRRLARWFGSLSFRTGVIMLCICVLCYGLSFAQMLLPVSIAMKGVLWAVFYGLAKAAQYSALLILGKNGLSRVKAVFRRIK